MYTIKLPWGLGELLLTPQWPGLPAAAQAGIVAAVLLVPLALMLWLYRYELRLVSGLTALTLLALRLTVLALLVLVVCLQPIHARTRTRGLPGKVVVAVDRSDSMEVADPQRTPAEKLRLARALKLAGDLCTEEQLGGWADAYDRKRDPQWLLPGEHADDPARRRDLEAKRRGAHDKVLARVDALTRSEAARRVLSDDGLHLLSALAAAGHQVELVGFHRDAFAAPAAQLEELFRKVHAPADKPGEDKSTAAAFTDLRLPLARALEASVPGDKQVLAVVLLTDGLHNTGELPTVAARQLGERHIPVYAVALGARKPPPDVAVLSLQAPPAVFKNVEAPVDVQYVVNGMDEQDVVIELYREGKERRLLGRRVRHHRGKDQAYAEHFSVQMDEVGTQVLTASVRPADPKVRETCADNNRRSTTLNVADDKAKVLLIDGEARWEYHYLANALKRDPTVKLRSVVFVQPRLDERLTPQELEQMGCPAQSLPGGPDALSEYDCILLGDLSPEQLPAAERTRLERYVADRGGTLVVVAGKRFMPLGFPEYDSSGQPDPLRKLLPLEAPRAVAGDDGFAVALSAAGRDTRFMQMDPDAVRSAEVWAGLQRHYWGVIGQAKPGATALAWYDPADGRPAARRERDHALMAWQHYGLGRVLFVGLDSTWRWRFKVGDQYHHAFWGAAIRWAATDKPLLTGNEFVRFGTLQPVYSRGEEVPVVVRLSDELGPVPRDLLAGARILLQGDPPAKEKAVALVPLGPRPDSPRVLEGKITGVAPGRYAVELVIPELAPKLQAPLAAPLRAGFTVRPPDSPELIELQTRWPLLEEIAARSGGKVFTPEDAAELVQLLSARSILHVERHEQRLWQSWVLLAVVLALLTLEWAGRKLAGLP
jgi:hypothetical protein